MHLPTFFAFISVLLADIEHYSCEELPDYAGGGSVVPEEVARNLYETQRVSNCVDRWSQRTLLLHIQAQAMCSTVTAAVTDSPGEHRSSQTHVRTGESLNVVPLSRMPHAVTLYTPIPHCMSLHSTPCSTRYVSHAVPHEPAAAMSSVQFSRYTWHEAKTNFRSATCMAWI